jgi:hypothetical protein
MYNIFMPINKIIIPVRPQPDTILAIYLLKYFGSKKFPNIAKATISIDPNAGSNQSHKKYLENGELLVDVGNGPYNHHGKEDRITASLLVARDLNIDRDPSFGKLLKYAERDDKFGLGTISKDPLDKAFGLSGLIGSMNKEYSDDPNKVVNIVIPLLEAHYMQENKRIKELPKVFEELKKEGKVVEVKLTNIKAILIESDNLSMPGYLRAQAGGKYDIVVQKRTSGHVNILSRPQKNKEKILLERLVVVIRTSEIYASTGKEIEKSYEELSSVGKISEVPNWYYDPATNSIQNGGISIDSTPPTKIPWEHFIEIVKIAFEKN